MRAPLSASRAIEPPAPKSGSSGWADTTSTRSNLGVFELERDLLRGVGFLVSFFFDTSLNLSDRRNRLFHRPLSGAVWPAPPTTPAGSPGGAVSTTIPAARG